jgi:hypothetical protein
MPAGSAIVLNASLVSIKGNPAFSVYSATKAALRSFARNWAVDLKGKGIRVNAVSPGVIPTQGYHTSLGMTEQQVDDYIRSVTPAIPLGRTGTTDEVAKAVAFLASDESSYITSELFVDGGQAQICGRRSGPDLRNGPQWADWKAAVPTGYPRYRLGCGKAISRMEAVCALRAAVSRDCVQTRQRIFQRVWLSQGGNHQRKPLIFRSSEHNSPVVGWRSGINDSQVTLT